MFAFEPVFRELIVQLESLEKLKEYINTQALQELSVQKTKLVPLESSYSALIEQEKENDKRVSQVVGSYNILCDTLSKKFVYWDEILLQAERKARIPIEEPQ